MIYENNSRYKNEERITKRAYVTETVVEILKKMISESDIFECDDRKWPEADFEGKEELEIVMGEKHISFVTKKIGSLLEVEKCKDKEGLKTFHFLSQDIKIFTISLINLHFKVNPI